ncbi:flagellar hook capping FlgD N-terminal domain-containing protein [Xanthomonas citri pv. glycines]|uniref:Basal-body rod modification protein FlgD n=3 Tax=Xanthomonas TaxID=338 RepID=A0A1T1NTG6_9XANT|nr:MULTISPECIES: flagellar hook capping FlgD N-terminal domain-containing protein [Xanthomonas]OOW91710.1 flagellar hook capping protein [Xanthomonas campestris pv. vitistrifoliae]AOY60823.1 flagellar hook capping protein [Xanthomonas citri pv. glycines str. 8ra]ARV21265.1 flagellar hook capping protein [Xanthomonas citri pv. glycines str. 12-2]EWC49949.1 flagellar hook capping protein [Xanthomonas citri pv. glycines str. 8ra]OEY91278.1 flagellar hook capping protein [Xanthomonas citri pv. gly
MAIDSIGAIVNNGSSSAQSNNTIDQDGFIKLFLSQLQFQDPLEPVDNREFLAQLAQFSNLEQSRQLSLNSEGALSMNATSQGLSLLSRRIEVTQASGNTATGVVKAIEFSASGPLLTVETSAGVLTGIRLPQITLVQQ